MSELRLVVLGRAEARTKSTVAAILGLKHDQNEDDQNDQNNQNDQNDQHQDDAKHVQECSKQRGEAAGRQVVLVWSPSWFGSGCDLEVRRRLLSSFLVSSSPGPHVFLLVVPLNQPSDGESRALDVLEELLGPGSLRNNTVILFTHTEELEEDEELEEYLLTWRKDLKELVERCGGRYHTLEAPRGGPQDQDQAVQELMEKVEQAVRDSGAEYFTSDLYREAEERLRRQQVAMVMERRKGPEPEEEGVSEEEMFSVREEAERSLVLDLDLDLERFFPPSPVSRPPPSVVGRIWAWLRDWLNFLPRMVRREALLGALVGLFVGGPVGGVMGATVGSVATEVVRRRTSQKTK